MRRYRIYSLLDNYSARGQTTKPDFIFTTYLFKWLLFIICIFILHVIMNRTLCLHVSHLLLGCSLGGPSWCSFWPEVIAFLVGEGMVSTWNGMCGTNSGAFTRPAILDVRGSGGLFTWSSEECAMYMREWLFAESIHMYMYILYHPCESWFIPTELEVHRPEGVVGINRLLHEKGCYSKFVSRWRHIQSYIQSTCSNLSDESIYVGKWNAVLRHPKHEPDLLLVDSLSSLINKARTWHLIQ